MSSVALRRLLHVASAGILLFAAPLSWPVFRWLIVAVGVLWLGSEWMRVRVPGVRDAVHRLVPVYRPHEIHRVSGAGWLLIGYAVAAWFPPAAATAGILVAALADPAAALVGSWLSPGGAKTIAGSAAFAVVALVVMLALGATPWVALPASAAGAAVERWSLGLNDNFVIPPTIAAVVAALA